LSSLYASMAELYLSWVSAGAMGDPLEKFTYHIHAATRNKQDLKSNPGSATSERLRALSNYTFYCFFLSFFLFCILQFFSKDLAVGFCLHRIGYPDSQTDNTILTVYFLRNVVFGGYSRIRHAYFESLEYLMKYYLYRIPLRDSPFATRNHAFQPRTALACGTAANSELLIRAIRG
jgi:hypothetical protein